jgi:hypothetical protein
MSNCGGCDEITLPLGQDGTDGKNAFTRTTSSFIQPAANQNITINVSNIGQFSNSWASVGQVIFISNLSGNGGYYSVVSTTGTESIEIKNLNYPGNTPENLPINFPANVSPSGPRGAAGGDGERGSDGDDGVGLPGLNGTTLLRAGQGTDISGQGTYTNIAPTLTFAANELCSQDNNKALFEASLYFLTIVKDGFAEFRLLVNGTEVTQSFIDSDPFPPRLMNQYSGGETEGSALLKVEIIRLPSNTARFSITYGTVQDGTILYMGDPITIDFNSTITINLQGRTPRPDANKITGCKTYSVSSFKQQ